MKKSNRPSLDVPSFYFNRISRSVFPGKLRNDTFDRHDRQRWQRTGMSLSVTDQSRFLCESLTADIADVRSLAGVYENVLFLSGLSSKRFAAHRTRKGLHAGVYSHMRVEVAAAKSLSARRTQHLLPGLVPSQVLLEILASRHPSSAYTADEFRFVVSVLHVSLQSVQILTKMSANVANDRRCSAVILFNVMIQRFLDLELFATGIARVIVAAGVQTNVMILEGTLVVALVLAHAALVHLSTMNPLDVGDQVPSKTERFRTVRALVPVLFQVFGQIALL